MGEFFASISKFFASTQVPHQIQSVEVGALFSNPWFLLPFLVLVGYLIYKKSINGLVFVAVVFGIWLFTGSSYMQGLVKGNELQKDKIIPIIVFGMGAIGVLVYFFFMKSD